MSKVLLAEDDQTMVSLLTTLLHMEGFEVIALTATSDVPGAVLQHRPDNLLIDYHLGHQNGIAVVENIRSNSANKNLNIVVASGLNVKDECLRRGADHFILKPFMPDDLLKLLKR
jgi:DNA-binding response OmpR family regulator